ncbi:MAG: L-rhamnose isomerase [Firmicutes bacterium]|nr:L-rhamnose isomerase [Bacillota bacterium]
MYDVQKGYELARELYGSYGVDVDRAIAVCDAVPVSMHCWQGDDVGGFEQADGALTGGIQATGNYPGKAKTPEQLRADIDFANRFIPGVKKINLHASYLESDSFVDRSEIAPEHFEKWADWAVERGYGLDFNPTFFSHPKSENGTLSNADEAIREFWIEHDRRCRRIGSYFAERTGKECVINHWTPDGSKEVPADTIAPRLRLKDSYDRIFAEPAPGVVDALESKVFGIGLESYTAGSHEFCLCYSMSRSDVIPTLDTGHFHPTEMVSAKLSALLAFKQKLLLHVSRPVRWDSDHVVAFDDETRAIMSELVRLNALDRVYIATDYFDASINRIAAWVIGMRNTRKALLEALLEPAETIQTMERSGDSTSRLAWTQEFRAKPFGLVWDYYCAKNNCGVGLEWLDEVKKYESEVTLKR